MSEKLIVNRMSPGSRPILISLFLFVLVVSCAVASLAQGIQGTLSGEVRDQTGGVVPGASITLTNMDTGENRSQVSSAVGTFIFPNLAIGRYSVTVEVSGFKKVVQKNITIKANQVTDVKVALELGNVS